MKLLASYLITGISELITTDCWALTKPQKKLFFLSLDRFSSPIPGSHLIAQHCWTCVVAGYQQKSFLAAIDVTHLLTIEKSIFL